MKIYFLLCCLPALFWYTTVTAQTKSYSKLELKPKEVFEVGPDNVLIVDTLIMQDRSTIKFSPETPGILKANVVIIGKSCTISSRGANGTDTSKRTKGTPGQNGGDLDITMQLKKLKSLTIDVRGGTGGDGLNGKDGKGGTPDRQEKQIVKGNKGQDIITYVTIPGIPGTAGTNATSGFNGGNGGSIKLTYNATDFIPVFNHSQARNSITLLHTKGDTGKDGEPGKGGFNSTDGQLIRTTRPEALDGQIKLTNAPANSGK